MPDNDFIIKLEEWFVNPDNEFDFTDISPERKSSVKRMIYSYRRYLNDSSCNMEFECVLRNIMLSYNTDILIPGYVPEQGNKFGLLKNSSTGRIYAGYDLPEYINRKFVYSVYNGKHEMFDDNQQIIPTNNFVYQLSKKRYKSFKSIEQQIAVMGSLRTPKGYTALISMSTGGGKSLITQTISYQETGLTIIVVPTISLMIDQHRSAVDIIQPETTSEIMYYNSSCNADNIVNAIKAKQLRMLFVSPEAIIKNKKIRDCLLEVNKESYLKNMIIDEAHIVVEWGSSFRVDFQCLDSFRKMLIKENSALRTFLLSATYSKKTVDNLKMFYSDDDKWIEIRLDTLRKEPRFDIVKCKSYSDKHNKLFELVCKLPHPMIIYVNTPDDAEKIQSELRDKGILNTRTFTGRTSSSRREEIINEWIDDKFDLMIATCAFGVGVDKRDVRTVVHTYIPSSPNQYYQECGRGGRDGLPCLSVLLYTDADIDSAISMKEKVLTIKTLSGRWFSMLKSEKSNIKIDRIVLDTSVKPDYSEKDEFYMEANSADVSWNVYVILLLRRYGLLNILNVEYHDERYIFTIVLNDNRLLNNNSQSTDILNRVREYESTSIYSEITELPRKLRNLSKECWSSMFNDVYMLTDEYCSGCNYHDDVLKDSTVHFPLKKPIYYPISECSEKVYELLCGRDELLIVSEVGTEKILSLLSKIGVDIIVVKENMDNSFVYKTASSYTKQLVMEYTEFFELSSINCNYYLSGSVAFLIDDDSNLAGRLLTINANKDYKKIYIVNNDFFVKSKNKNISELINGRYIQDYIIEKELE